MREGGRKEGWRMTVRGREVERYKMRVGEGGGKEGMREREVESETKGGRTKRLQTQRTDST